MQESWSRVTSTLAESVSGIRVTQAFVRQEINAGFFRKLINVHGENNVGVAQASAVFVPLLQLKSQLFLGAMALLSAYGALSWHGWLHMEVGDLVMFFFLANLFFDPVQVIGNQLNQALMAMAGAERLFRMLDQKPEWQDAAEAKPLPAIRGRVEFQSVQFEYQPGRPVLRDISFTAEPGQTVALVGHTGSGKTTLVALLQKFYLPTGGCVRVDGMDLNTVTSDSLRSQMGSVQQNNFLFSGTVLDNIRLARPDATEADVQATLKALDCAGPDRRAAARIAFTRWLNAARRCRSVSGNWSVLRGRCWRIRASWCSTRRPARLTRSPRRACSGRWKFCCADARRLWWRTA